MTRITRTTDSNVRNRSHRHDPHSHGIEIDSQLAAFFLQVPGSVEILRTLLPGEIVPPLNVSVKRFEFPVNGGFRSNLQLGDRLIVRCFFKGESR